MKYPPQNGPSVKGTYEQLLCLSDDSVMIWFDKQMYIMLNEFDLQAAWDRTSRASIFNRCPVHKALNPTTSPALSHLPEARLHDGGQ